MNGQIVLLFAQVTIQPKPSPGGDKMASTSNGRRGYWRYIQVAGGVEALLFDASGETIISKNPRRHFLDGVEFYPGEWRALLAEVYNEDCRRGN